MGKTILIVVGQLGNGGAERASLNLANFLARRNWDVHMVLFFGERSEYPVDERIRLYVLKNHENSCLRKIVRLWSFERYLREIRPDLLLSQGFGYPYLDATNAYRRCKVVLCEINDPASSYPTAFSRWYAQHSFKRAYRVAFQTREEQEFFPESVREKSEIIPNPLKEGLPHRFTGQRRKEIVSFCRFEPQKNLSLLIRAFHGVHEKHPDYRLSLYGRGSEEEKLKTLTRDLGLTNAVTFHPFSSTVHEDVLESAMYVSSSHYEGLSNAMIEAMAIGLPCVCTDSAGGGARSLIRSYENGILVPPDDEAALTRGMLDVIEQPGLSEKLSANASKLRDVLDSDMICEQFEALLR